MRLLVIIFICTISNTLAQLPKGFSYIKDVCPTIICDLRYFSTNNFVGRKIEGYQNNILITSTKTAIALNKVQKELLHKGLGLKIFDAYRPQRAVNHFIRWSKKIDDTITKQEYYPKFKKRNLFRLGFISTRSGHSRGSSVDLTLINLKTKKEIPMGSPYDYFGEISATYSKQIHKAYLYNRLILKSIMVKHNFKPYSKREWWHFTLKNEPFRNKYFNFPVR